MIDNLQVAIVASYIANTVLTHVHVHIVVNILTEGLAICYSAMD